MAEGRVRGFSVATKCATVDDVIEKFRDRVDEQSILVNTVESRDIGTECAFAILLADKRVALAGTCVVKDVYADSNNKFQRPGMRLEIKRLGPESQRVWSELVAKRVPPRRLTTSIPVVVPPATPSPTGKPAPSRTKTQAMPTIAVPRTATKPLHGARADSPPGAGVGSEITPPRRLSTVQIPSRDAQPDAKGEPLGRAPRATPFNPSVAEGSHDAAPRLEINHEATEPTLVPGESQPGRPNEFARGSATTVESNKVRVPPSDPVIGAKLAPVLARASSPVVEPKPAAADAQKPTLAIGTDDQLPVVPRTGTKLGAQTPPAGTLATKSAQATSEPAIPRTSTSLGTPALAKKPASEASAAKPAATAPEPSATKPAPMKPGSFLAKPTAATTSETPARKAAAATKPEPVVATPAPRAKSEPRAATSLGTPALARKPAAGKSGPVAAPSSEPTSTPNVAPAAATISAATTMSAGPAASAAALKIEPVAAKSEPRVKSEPATEARTPGSAFVLPANPLMNLTDASLEGFIDCRLFEAQSGDQSQMTAPLVDPDAPPDDILPAMPPIEEHPLVAGEPLAAARPAVPHLRLVPPAPEPEPEAPKADPVVARAPTGDRYANESAIVAAPLEPMRSEPMPLPPPPPARPTASIAAAVPYTETGLPNLNVGEANDDVRAPIVSRRTRNRLLLACVLVPLLGAAAVVGFMRFTAPAPTAAPLQPAEITATTEPVQTMAPIEPAPEAPAPPAAPELPPAPTRPQPIHAVLVRSAPIAAKVTVNGKSFGTTPTYVKIPANTPVELHIERAGFAPITYPMVSKTAIDRVFVRLQRTRGGK